MQVPGTNGNPFLFGREPNQRPIEVPPFYVATTPVTQALWLHVMGSNPSVGHGLRCPEENVSWKHITEPGGFLDRLNAGEILAAVNNDDAHLRFQLPSESEWEYAARGGPAWKDGFIYSGSNDADKVAWYGPRWTRADDLVARMFGWRFAWHRLGRIRSRTRRTRTHDVALKAP